MAKWQLMVVEGDDWDSPTGEIVETQWSRDEYYSRRDEETFLLSLDDGRNARPYFAAKHGAVFSGAWDKGNVSHALEVPGRSLDKAKEHFKSIGMGHIEWKPVQGTARGMQAPVFRTKRDKANFFRRSGDNGQDRIHNFDGGYGDGG